MLLSRLFSTRFYQEIYFWPNSTDKIIFGQILQIKLFRSNPANQCNFRLNFTNQHIFSQNLPIKILSTNFFQPKIFNQIFPIKLFSIEFCQYFQPNYDLSLNKIWKFKYFRPTEIVSAKLRQSKNFRPSSTNQNIFADILPTKIFSAIFYQ